MAGCFGNHPVDRYLERQLNKWLDEEQVYVCPNCAEEDVIDNLEVDDNDNVVCPHCGEIDENL